MGFRFFTTIDVSELDRLNTTSYRQVVMTRATTWALLGLGVAFAHAMYVGDAPHHEVAERIMDSVLLFLATAMGVNTAQYGMKRFSDSGYAAAKASGAPSAVVQTTGTVVQQAPGGPVDTGNTTTVAAPASVPARRAPDADQGTPDVLAASSEPAAEGAHEWSDGRPDAGAM